MADTPQINPTPSLIATLIPFPCPIGCSASAPCMTCYFAFCSLPCYCAPCSICHMPHTAVHATGWPALL